MAEVKRVNNRLISTKLVIGGSTLNVISAYATQVGLDKEEKKSFCKDLDEVVRGILSTEKLCIGGVFNGHIASLSGGYNDVYNSFDFGKKNDG